jgi:adenosylcobinamide-phosphate synthase
VGWFAMAGDGCSIAVSVDLADKTQNFVHFRLRTAYWSARAAIIFVVAYALVHALATLPALLAAVLPALPLKPRLAWRMLLEEIMAVRADDVQ